MNEIDKIDFKKGDGIVPVIVQEYETNEVLMLAYMNKEALELTTQTNYAHYFSRSKQRLWKKGESSGHTQEIKEILYDCDQDTILLKVIQNGVACHTGRSSCFFTNLKTGENTSEPLVDTSSSYGVIDTLYHTLLDRKKESTETSYTSKLINGDENSMLKKIVEEAGEFSFAVKDKNEKEMIYEAADITYHVLVALAKYDISPDRIKQELARRFGMSGIDEKNSRDKK